MFFCEHEHEVISHKRKERRSNLTDAAKQLMTDLTLDPVSPNMLYEEDELHELLKDLNENFPGIDNEEVSQQELSTSFTGLATTQLALARSLDNCFGGLIEEPTLQEVETRLSKSFSEGLTTNIDRRVAKKWCSEVADRLCNVNVSGRSAAELKSSINELQDIIAGSVAGSEEVFKRIVDENKTASNAEDEKLCEDEIARLQTEISEVQDWITAVASQLDAHAVEMDDGHDSASTSSSAPSKETASSSLKPSDSSLRQRGSEIASHQFLRKASSVDTDEMLWEKVLSSRESHQSPQKLRRATSIETVGSALQRSQSRLVVTKTDPILEKMKRDRGHSHHVDLKTSYSTVLWYLCLVGTAFVLFAVATSKYYQQLLSFFVGSE